MQFSIKIIKFSRRYLKQILYYCCVVVCLLCFLIIGPFSKNSVFDAKTMEKAHPTHHAPSLLSLMVTMSPCRHINRSSDGR